MLESSGFQNLKNSTSCIFLQVVNGIEMLCFLLLKANTQANAWIFSDSAQA
jgi:hypothetical protein